MTISVAAAIALLFDSDSQTTFSPSMQNAMKAAVERRRAEAQETLIETMNIGLQRLMERHTGYCANVRANKQNIADMRQHLKDAAKHRDNFKWLMANLDKVPDKVIATVLGDSLNWGTTPVSFFIDNGYNVGNWVKGARVNLEGAVSILVANHRGEEMSTEQSDSSES